MCTDTVKEAQFTASKWAYIIDKNDNSDVDVSQKFDVSQGSEGKFKSPMWNF